MKTEETEKLKTEIKDLKEIIKLSEHLDEHDLETSNVDENTIEKEEENFTKIRNNGVKSKRSHNKPSDCEEKLQKEMSDMMDKKVIEKEERIKAEELKREE